MKISLGMIVRNEGATLENCLKSIAPYVDEIVVGFAGKSTDNTEAIAKKYATYTVDIEWTDHFADARNQVLTLQMASSPDYIMWLDGDDLVVGAEKIRGIIEDNPEVDVFHMGYDYGRDAADSTVCFLIRERIIRADSGWTWKGRIHEILVNDNPGQAMLIQDVVVRHFAEHKVRGNRNIELLYQELRDSEPNPDPRVLVYLGNEEAVRGNLLTAIALWKRFVTLTPWNEEVYQAQHKIADVFRALGRLKDAREADFEAIRIAPHWPDAYFGLAETAYRDSRWNECIEWTKAGATKEVPTTSLVINPLDYYYYPRITVATAYMHVNDVEMAMENFRMAHEYRPTPDTQSMLDNLTEGMTREAQVKAFLYVLEQLCRNDEWLKARKLFESAPKAIEQDPRVVDMMQMVFDNTVHVEYPELMEQYYVNNPHWSPMDEEAILSDSWKSYPRLAYAFSVAKAVEASTIVDLGCSDGFMSLPLARDGYRVDGVDLDPRCIALASDRAVRFGLDDKAKFSQGNLETVNSWAECEAFVPYSLAILFETIEHVVSPAELLAKVEKVADHIAITTPFLAWEKGRIDNWAKREPKGHLRIFDLTDIEMLLSSRGTIHNLYRQPWGDTGWIFADYAVGKRLDGHIQIVCPGGLEPWGPQKYRQEGLGGSETAAIRLGEEFANLGKLVSVYNQIDSPGYYNKVRYRPVEQFHPAVKSELTIAWRYPELGDTRPNTKQFVLWMHDVDAGDRLTALRAASFDRIVVLTNWHKYHMLKKYPFVKPEQLVVIGNGTHPEFFRHDEVRNPKRVVYTSSPDRGLDVILEHIWPKVIEAVPDAELHYYYGWNNIDAASAMMPELQQFKAKVANLSMNTKNVVNHGRLPQAELAKELLRSSIWLYPTYFAETFCISAVEAQLAGLHAITNDLAALAETIGDGPATIIKGDVRDPKVIEKYVEAVVYQLTANQNLAVRDEIKQGARVNSWADIAALWCNQVLRGANDERQAAHTG